MLAARAAADPTLSLPEISVESSRLDTYLPARTEVSREELVDSRKSELTSVLDFTPGVNVRSGGRGETRLDIRGFDQRSTLFTLNGIPIYEPYNGIVNLNLFPIDMLGGVEITRGPSSALYGPNGMAGTVRMTTFGGRRPLGAFGTMIWRNADFWDLRAGAAAAKDGFSGLLGGRYLTTPGFPLSSDFFDRPPNERRYQYGDRRTNSDRDEKSLFANLGYEWSSQSRVHATVLATTSEFGIPPTTTQFSPQFLRNEGQDLIHVQAGIDHRLWPNAGVAAGVFYSLYTTTEATFTDPDYRTKLFTTTAKSSEPGFIGRFTVDIGNADSLAVGTLVRYASADISNTVSGTLNEPAFTIATLAAENVYALTDRIVFLLGLSWGVQTGGGVGTRSEVNPQGGVSVDFGAYGQTRAAITRKVQFPTLRQLYDPIQGNPALEPEVGLTFELGHRIAVPLGYFDLNLYRAQVDSYISDGGTGDPGPATNLDGAVLQGVEVVGGVTPVSWLRLDLNYTYLDAEARNPLTDELTTIQHKPANRFNGILRIDLPYACWLRLEGQYGSEQVERFGTGIVVPAVGVFNVQVARDFGSLLSVFAGVDNVLDADNEQRLGTPEPGRWVFAGLRATYP